ncbi:hypothetical protein [Spartinivicinus poritis]|uniref:Uncharacterized protein n=1 Tax=Spartinivicinus poritis TaxID=2994640 RepID=A0ABT5UA96_9GAMM|nr:hypothetical protein [Spartinivicinus sp. A2-2]MDE1462059.1 hypothetical protein [Spartinivicinus sp. A2-2]
MLKKVTFVLALTVASIVHAETDPEPADAGLLDKLIEAIKTNVCGARLTSGRCDFRPG